MVKRTARITVTPAPTPAPTPEPTPTPVAAPTAVPTAKPTAKPRTPRPARVVAAGPAVFHGLGTWFDLYDDPSALVPAVPVMAGKGVKTLYLEWGKSSCSKGARFLDPRVAGAALDAAHQAGMAVVAWYYLDFTDIERDLARTMEAVRFTSPEGKQFDGIGVDIEDNACVKDPADRNARLLDYSRRLRDAVAGRPLAAIPIAPSSLSRNPNRWPNFPWSGLAPLYDVFMPMNYWTGTGANPANARAKTLDNAREITRLTGKPAHVAGGLAAQVDAAQANAFVEACLEAGCIGGSLYDYASMNGNPGVWEALARLNR